MTYGRLRMANAHRAASMRHANREEISHLKRKLFGYQSSGMPGEGQFIKPLDGKSWMRWNWPSRYMIQDFRIDQYLEMQAKRFLIPPTHPSIIKLKQVVNFVIQRQTQIEQVFAQIDKPTFIDNPALHDIYAIYRTINPNHNPLKFDDIPPEIWQNNNFSWIHQNDYQNLSLLEEPKPDIDHHIDKLNTESASMMTMMDSSAEGQDDDMEILMDSQAASDRLEEKLAVDEEVEGYLKRRHRFIEPQLRKRRNAFLVKNQKGKAKPREKFYAEPRYTVHPDRQKIWPNNKGQLTKPHALPFN